jgi:hypothetical protein
MWPFPKQTPAPSSDDGAVYAAYIKSLFDYEQNRKTVLEAKASAVVTTSGTLVTLLFGLVAVVTGAKSFTLPVIAHAWLIGAVALFVIAVALAVTTANIPVPYGQATFDAKELQQAWKESASAARSNVAAAQLQQIDIARQKNDIKAKLVRWAAVGELLALLMLAVAVVLILK